MLVNLSQKLQYLEEQGALGLSERVSIANLIFESERLSEE